MHVSLFKALRAANVDDASAETVVRAVEEHIDMAVADAMKHYEEKLSAMQAILEAKIEHGLKGVQTSIDGLKWYVIIVGTLLTTAVAVGGVLTAYVQLIR